MFAPMLGLYFEPIMNPENCLPTSEAPLDVPPMKKQPEHRNIGESQALSTALHVMTLTVRQWGRAKHVVPQTR